MAVEIKFDQEVRDKLKAGVDALANAVKVTLGPKGKNVIIGRHTEDPQVTKDGVTVAKDVVLEDELENMGATVVKRVAEKSNDLAGDGTTTATVLTQAILEEGMKLVSAGYDPVQMKRGIDAAVISLVKELDKMAITVDTDNDMIQQIATISANNDPVIGNLVAEAFGKVGKDGAVSVEEGSGYDTKVVTVDGLQFDRGLLSTYFSTSPEKTEATFKDPYILVVDGKVTTVKQVMATLEPVAKTGRPLIIMAENVEGQALSTMVMNKMRGGLEIAAIQTPGFGSYRSTLAKDIAAIVGAEVVPEKMVEDITEEFTSQLLGEAKIVTMGQNSTIIMGGARNDEAVDTIVESIDKQLADDTVLPADKERLSIRRAKLKGGVAVIEVGAGSEIDMKEKKDRVDDAKEAVVSALEEGVVAGGGMALITARETVRKNPWPDTKNADYEVGVDILLKAIEAPFRTICENANVSADVNLEGVLSRPTGTGYNAKNDEYVEMMSEGILDPKKVTRIALQSAASVAGTLLTTSCGLIPKTQ